MKEKISTLQTMALGNKIFKNVYNEYKESYRILLNKSKSDYNNKYDTKK